jgi:protein TonB
MLRLSLFLLLSLALHGAGWLLHGTAQPPALSHAQARAAPQVLRLAAVVQQVAPAPAKAPEPVPAQPQQQVAVTRALPIAKPVAALQPAKPKAAVPQPQAAPALKSPIASPSVTTAALLRSARAAPVSAQPGVEVLSSTPSFREPPRQPSYPAQARRRNQQGVVLVEVRLDARGQQRSVNVLRSSGVDSLDRAALAAVAQWRFRPETSGGQAVPSRVQIPIQFALTASR